MFRTITARFDGTCRRCGGAFEAGDSIRYGGRGRTYHLKRECSGNAYSPPRYRRTRRSGPVDDSPGARASYYDPRGAYSADGTFLGTVGRRCEDAPCCGCCS